MNKFKSFILSGAVLASMAACDSKSTEKELQIEETRKNLIETVIKAEKDNDWIWTKEFNDAISKNDLEKSLYSLAQIYESRSIYMVREINSLGRLESNAYWLIPQIKEFSEKFWKNPRIEEIRQIYSSGRLWMWMGSLWDKIGIILNWSKSLQKENQEQENTKE